ncbi:hypothetical protein [Spirosoma sordidisoli]|uniref:Uncharacterized protein n=1 Tax=Spirosoma sordidisoli TaxID=2502893 RepID=A0A4Q2UBB7_9BACT|nr:hypothetical protein [Spirosoma sordidisoli]RYC66313.1 hypothetical protein EQG79_30015 [Spirosoma sordidisoli]
MSLEEKLEMLHRASGAKSFAGFAELVDVNVQTLRRIGHKGECSDRIINRIAGRFQGLTPEVLADPTQPLPSNLRVIPRPPKSDDVAIPAEGEQLRRYLVAKRIRPAHLAETMGVTRTQVHYYLKTHKFEESNKAAILAALKVPASAVFIDQSILLRHAGQRPATNLLSVLMIRPEDRVTDAPSLTDEMLNFTPLLAPPGRSFYVSPALLEAAPADLARCVAIQITAADKLGPTFQPGAIVLGRLVERQDWRSISTTTAALIMGGRLSVRRLLRNDLGANQQIEVGSFSPQDGPSQLIHENDIEAMFAITHILLSPA